MAAQQDGRMAADRDSREIYREIQETRTEMDRTLDEIGDRLHPRHLVDELVSLFDGNGDSDRRSTRRVKSAGKQLLRKVKQHPVPALLCGGGIAWLLLEDDDEPDRSQAGAAEWDRAGVRGAAAWNDEFDWDDTHEDEQGWSERATRALKDIQSSLDDQQLAARDKIRSSASKLMGVSGRRRSEIHSQWDDIGEHSGSFVDARTGEPYDESYGKEWRALVCCDIAASEDWSEEDEQRLSEKAQQSISRMRQAAGDSTLSTKRRLRAVADQLSDFVSQSQEVSSRYGSKARSKLSRAAASTQRGFSRAGSASKQGAHATRQSAMRGYQSARAATEESFDNYPLAFGAAVLGAGLIGGLLLPRTRREDQVMGPTADEMKRKAGRAGQEAMQRGQEVAQSAASAGMEEMERQGMTPDRVAEEARDAGSQMKEIAREKVPNPEQIREKAEQVAERSAETAKQESQRHVHEAQTRSNPR